MEPYITLTFLNDFIFCPRSIYFHQLYGNFHHSVYKHTPQYLGEEAHRTIDEKLYSTSTNILQGMEVFSSRYNICGKIDLFDAIQKKLTERKREIKKIFDGYIFQVYAQYFGLIEAGYEVLNIFLYDLTHNKKYPILLPEENPEMLYKFEMVINDINNFDLEKTPFIPNQQKCENCIYKELCDTSLC